MELNGIPMENSMNSRNDFRQGWQGCNRHEDGDKTLILLRWAGLKGTLLVSLVRDANGEGRKGLRRKRRRSRRTIG
jgi:hypothetical protein